MEEFVNKLGIKIKFTPVFLPWSNGVNERNHYNCDVIVRKIMDDDKKVGLGETVDMASWTHNTNVNVLGFPPLPLMTVKSVTFPGLMMGDMATDLMYDDEMIRRIMECHYAMMKDFRELEFSKKLRKASKTRMKGYEDVKISEGDLVYYQHQDMKAWLGPAKVFASKGNDIFIFANGNIRKVPKCNVQLCEKETMDEEGWAKKIKSNVKFEEEGFGDNIVEKDIW